MNVMEPIWVKTFITNTYSCVKNRGIHKLAKDIQRDLKLYPEKTKYCLKIDITKFYPSIDHEILKQIIRRKIKDKKLLVLLDEIIDSADGVPIGNYLSQFFANLYLTYFDHWLKEEIGLKFYYRYADDIVILHDSKEFLHNVLIAMKFYLNLNLKLKIKPNYQIFPVDSRGIDFVGYKFFHTHTLLRKSIKLRLNKLKDRYLKGEISLSELDRRMSSYFGWLKYCNSKNLLHKIEKQTGLGYSNWNGEESPMCKFYRKKVWIVELISHKKYYEIHLIYNKIPYTVYSTNRMLFINILNKNRFPLQFQLLPYVRRKKNRVKSKTKDN